MKKLFSAFVIGLGLFAVQSMNVQADDTMQMYRLYNPNSGEHFYTGYTSEKNHLVEVGWKDEGIAWYAPLTGNPVYRLYNPNSGDHHYTMSYQESQNLIQKGWKDEEIGWYSDVDETIPLYRLYNPNAKVGTHHYTTNINERANLIKVGWQDEEIGWYGVMPETTDEPQANDNIKNPSAIEQAIFKIINEEREKRGLMPLEWSEEVYEAAKARAVEATNSDEEHLKNHLRLDDREARSIFEDLGLSYKFIDETISMRQFTKTNTQTAQNFYEGLAKSANYLNIMMEPNALFYAVAIEDTDVATMGPGLYAVQIFAR